MVNLELTYIILTYISIACYLFLFGHCVHRSSNYLLRVFCIVSVINSICESFFLFIYPDFSIEQARGTITCTISAILEQYTPLAINLLAACMGFNIWLLVVQGSKSTERSLFKWYCLFSFGVPVVTTATSMAILRRKDPNFTAVPRKYFCDFEDTKLTLLTFGLPMVMASIPSILFALHTVIYLARHHFVVRHATNIGNTSVRNVPYELGHCLRLIFFCFAMSTMVILLFIQQAIQANRNNDPVRHEPDRDFPIFSDFTDCLGGIIFFIIFGTTNHALDTLGYLLSCGCIRTRLERRRRRHDPRAERLGSTSSSLGRWTTGAMTLQEAMDVDLESNLSTLTSLPIDSTITLPVPPMHETHSTMLDPAGLVVVSPHSVYSLVTVPSSIYTPDFKNYPK